VKSTSVAGGLDGGDGAKLAVLELGVSTVELIETKTRPRSEDYVACGGLRPMVLSLNSKKSLENQNVC
jgi:hypothetical protein